MMMVNSIQLENAAATVRKRKHGPQTLPEEEVTVSAAQLDTAAKILREAEPSIITKASGGLVGNVPLNVPQERPGFIEKLAQDEPEVLVFQVGILPSDTYRIDREGKIL